MLAQDPELAAALAMLRAEIGSYLREVFAAREDGPEAVWAAEGADALFDRFAAADPTPGKRYVGWLLHLYFADRLQAWEIAEGRATAVFAAYDRVRRDVDPETRLFFDASLDELESAVRSVAELDRARRSGRQARRETTYLYEDAELTVAIPETELAMNWHLSRGDGDASFPADFANYLHDRKRHAPWVVFAFGGEVHVGHAPDEAKDRLRDRERLAEGRAPTGPSELADALAEAAPRLRAAGLTPLLLAFLGPDGAPDATPADWLEAIRAYGAGLSDVPPAAIDRAVCVAAVARDGLELRHVPPRLRTRDLCLLAVSRAGLALDHVPEELRDAELCAAAFADDARALRGIPPALVDRDLRLAAVRRNGFALSHIPEEARDREICEAAIRDHGFALRYVPRALVDADMCRRAFEEAVWDRGMAFEVMPDEFRARDLCRQAAAAFPVSLCGSVPERFRDREICLLALLGWPGALRAFPPALRDRSACRLAVAWDGRALAHVPAELRDLALCRAAVQADAEALEFAPEDLRDIVAVTA